MRGGLARQGGGQGGGQGGRCMPSVLKTTNMRVAAASGSPGYRSSQAGRRVARADALRRRAVCPRFCALSRFGNTPMVIACPRLAVTLFRGRQAQPVGQARRAAPGDRSAWQAGLHSKPVCVASVLSKPLASPGAEASGPRPLACPVARHRPRIDPGPRSVALPAGHLAQFRAARRARAAGPLCPAGTPAAALSPGRGPRLP